MIQKTINSIRALNIFAEIDFQFANYIMLKEKPKSDSEALFMAVLCLSHYANHQHSALPLIPISGQSLADFSLVEFDAETNSDICSLPDFNDFRNWPDKFPITIGEKDDFKPLILDRQNGLLYLNKYYRAETFIADFIRRLSKNRQVSPEQQARLNTIFAPKEGQVSPKNDWQKAAAFMALRSNFCVISGGPGTGKTTTVGKILAVLLEGDMDCKIDLVAPTGKAADRLSESIEACKKRSDFTQLVPPEVIDKIPSQATTIHRYLAFNGGSKEFRHNADNRTASDLLLIDEASMVDLPMFRFLLSALPDHCRVILLGDKDQLTAVDTGNVLGDLTSAPDVNQFSASFCREYESFSGEEFSFSQGSGPLADSVIKLEHSYRFTADSGIGQLAYFINNLAEANPDIAEQSLSNEQTQLAQIISHFSEEIKISPVPNQLKPEFKPQADGDLTQRFFKLYKDKTFQFKKSTAEMTLRSQQQRYEYNLEVRKVLDFLATFRLLCATRSGKYGSDNINREISKAVFNRQDQALYHSRCIMIRQNNRALGLYNGDVGVILENPDGIPEVYFPDQEQVVKHFSPTILPEFETAFAMTIHKSQGSEFDNVRIILPAKENKLLTKELIYTGITRGKKTVELSTDIELLLQASRRRTTRFSGLAQRLSN